MARQYSWKPRDSDQNIDELSISTWIQHRFDEPICTGKLVIESISNLHRTDEVCITTISNRHRFDDLFLTGSQHARIKSNVGVFAGHWTIRSTRSAISTGSISRPLVCDLCMTKSSRLWSAFILVRAATNSLNFTSRKKGNNLTQNKQTIVFIKWLLQLRTQNHRSNR